MANEAQDMTAMAMRYWSDLAQMWLGPWAQFTPQTPWSRPRAEASWDTGGPDRPTRNERTEDRLAVAVEISSVQPTEVTVDLQDRSARQLVAQDLRAVDGEDKPPLVAVRFEQVDGRLRVALTVPRDQPAGVYAGAIIDQKRGAACGTLTVAVRAQG